MTTCRCWLAVVLLVVLAGCATNREIVTDLHEKEANEIIVFLAGHNIPAEKMAQATAGVGGAAGEKMWAIEVPSGQAVEALAILSRNGLPRRPVKGLLTIFAKSGLVSSAQEEQIRYQEGLATQIAGVIRKIDGVIDADVQISFPSTETGPQGPGAEDDDDEVRASVYVKHSGLLDDPNTQLVNKIKRLVAGSIAGLTFDNVTVVTDRARFTEVALDAMPDSLPEREYESVWGITIAKDSVSAFQAIFVVLCLIILVLAAAIGWLFWKVFPLVQQGGGLWALMNNLRPLSVGPAPPKPTSEEEEESTEE